MDLSARGIFLRAVFLLPLIRVSLRVCGFRATQRLLERMLDKKAKSARAHGQKDFRAHQSDGVQTARMVDAAVRHVWHSSTCLEKSLTIWWLLERQGVRVALRIGARKNGGQFEAHAWTELDGSPVNEPQEAHRHYAAFDAEFSSLPREAS